MNNGNEPGGWLVKGSGVIIECHGENDWLRGDNNRFFEQVWKDSERNGLLIIRPLHTATRAGRQACSSNGGQGTEACSQYV